MSRTDKDRPYWVIQDDRTLGRTEHHDHTMRYSHYKEPCTIDEPYADWRGRGVGNSSKFNPCWVEVPGWKAAGRWYDPQTDERKQDNRRRRRSASVALRSLPGEYNLHGEVDDSEWFDYAPPHAPFKGGWWD